MREAIEIVRGRPITLRWYTEEEAKQIALAKFPLLKYAKVSYGLNMFLEPTWSVELWRTEECCLNNEPPVETVESLRRDTGKDVQTVMVFSG